jgi:hypothetical protein
MSAGWVVWSLQRSDGSGLEVGQGTRAEAQDSARRRNDAAARQKMTGVAFVALPAGQRPTWDDVPPVPELPPEAPAAQPRTLMSVQNDLSKLAMARFSSPADRAEAWARARGLANEAFELGKAEARQENRKALGRAWGAFLTELPAEFWRCLPYDDPDLYRRLRTALPGEKP